jgi:hypothetical protein
VGDGSKVSFVTRWGVTIDGFWIGFEIYWTPWYSAWLHFAIYCYTHTSSHSHVFISCCSVAASNCETFSFLWVPELSPVSPTSLSQQQLATTELQQFSNCSLHSTVLNCTALTPLIVLLITSRHGRHRKHYSSVAVYGSLPSKGRCLVVCFAVVS